MKQNTFTYAGIGFTPAYDLKTDQNREVVFRLASDAPNLLSKEKYNHADFYKEAAKVSHGETTELFACKYGYFFPCERPFFVFLNSFGETSCEEVNKLLKKLVSFEHKTPPAYHYKVVNEQPKEKVFPKQRYSVGHYYLNEYKIWDNKNEQFLGDSFASLEEANFFLKKLIFFLHDYELL